mgnify:CR=1 FL=1
MSTDLLILILIALISTAIVVRMIKRPSLSATLLIISVPIISLFWGTNIGGISVIELFYGSYFILLILLLFVGKRENRKGNNEIIYVAVFMSAFIWPYIINPDFPFVFVAESVFKAMFGPLTLIIVMYFWRAGDKSKYLNVTYGAVVLFLTAAAVQLITGIGVGEQKYSYILGFYADEGSLSRAASLGVIMSLPVPGDDTWKSNRILVRSGILLFSITVLGMSISRNAILGTGIIIVYYTLYTKKYHYAAFVAIAVFLIYSNISVVESGLTTKISREMSYIEGENVNVEYLGSGRVGRWLHAWEVFKKMPLLNKVFGSGATYGPHGQYMEILLRSGILGFIVVFGFYARYSIKVSKISKIEYPDIRYYIMGYLIYFWVMCLTATPIYEFFMQSVLFGTYGVYFVEVSK